jgi:hypothetical protein
MPKAAKTAEKVFQHRLLKMERITVGNSPCNMYIDFQTNFLVEEVLLCFRVDCFAAIVPQDDDPVEYLNQDITRFKFKAGERQSFYSDRKHNMNPVLYIKSANDVSYIGGIDKQVYIQEQD